MRYRKRSTWSRSEGRLWMSSFKWIGSCVFHLVLKQSRPFDQEPDSADYRNYLFELKQLLISLCVPSPARGYTLPSLVPPLLLLSSLLLSFLLFLFPFLSTLFHYFLNPIFFFSFPLVFSSLSCPASFYFLSYIEYIFSRHNVISFNHFQAVVP